MSYWDGTRWVQEQAAPSAPRPSRAASWAGTAVMVVGLAAVIAPLQLIAGASHKADPGVAVVCSPAPCTVGGSMTVTGWGYAPSAGGQQVILWVGYPNDYCGVDACHGVYANPWVASDGTFSVTFTNALTGASYTANISGPSHIDFVRGTNTQEGRIGGPVGSLPRLNVFAGRVDFVSGVMRGRLIADVCALLAPPA